MNTILFGAIEEYGLNSNNSDERYDHNARVIAALPLSDSWPPVSKEMFSFTQNSPGGKGPDLEYESRVIHFGASLKGVEYEWEDWKSKFEQLLEQLFWLEANVYCKPEVGATISCHWRVDLKKWANEDSTLRPSREAWMIN